MNRGIATLVVGLSLLSAPEVFAQDDQQGPARLEVAVIPGGGTFFMQKGAGPSFGNYDLGGSVTYNFNRVVGVEGEVGGTLGVTQDLKAGGFTDSVKTPNIINYSGNVVIHAPTHSAVVPYVTGGVGGFSLLKNADLGIGDTTTLFTSNVGGGVKWYANRWLGLRADYRFISAASKDDAPTFFGQDTRYGHRVYGAVVINAIR
jgi:hypothetical protein